MKIRMEFECTHDQACKVLAVLGEGGAVTVSRPNRPRVVEAGEFETGEPEPPAEDKPNGEAGLVAVNEPPSKTSEPPSRKERAAAARAIRRAEEAAEKGAAEKEAEPDPTPEEEREAIQGESKDAVAAAIKHGEGMPAAIADARRFKDLIDALWDEGFQTAPEMIEICKALKEQGHRAVKRAVSIDDRIRRSIERLEGAA